MGAGDRRHRACASARARHTREIYIVVDGEVELQLDDRMITLVAGGVAEIPAGTRHMARSRQPYPARVVVVTFPAYSPADHRLLQ